MDSLLQLKPLTYQILLLLLLFLVALTSSTPSLSQMQLLLVFYLLPKFQYSRTGSIGKDSYIMSLAGVTSWDQGGTASEIGLFRDTDTFGVLPAGASPTPADYNIESISYDM